MKRWRERYPLIAATVDAAMAELDVTHFERDLIEIQNHAEMEVSPALYEAWERLLRHADAGVVDDAKLIMRDSLRRMLVIMRDSLRDDFPC